MPRYWTRACLVGSCVVLMLTFPGLADAQSSIATFDKSVQLPGVMLPAGKYRFASANNDNQVIVSDTSGHVIAILTVRPVTRTAAGAVLTLREISGAAPEVSGWYVSGGRRGLEFVYPRAKK